MKLYFLIIWTFIGIAGQAQMPLRYAEKVLSAEWQTYNKVIDLVEDQYGMLWLGTDKGLYRYDGHDLKEASQLFPDTLGLLSDAIGRLTLIDSSLWVGTEKEGAIRLNLAQSTFTHWSHQPEDSTSLPDPRITFLADWERFDVTLIGTHLHGLVAVDYEGNITRQIRPSNYISVINDRSIDVITDAVPIQGTNYVLLASLEGVLLYDWSTDTLARYVPNTANTTPVDDLSLNALVIRTCILEGDTVAWLGTWGGGLLRFHLESKQFQLYLFEENPANDAFSNNIRYLSLLNDSTLFVPSTHSNGLLFNLKDRAFTPWLSTQFDLEPKSFYAVSKGNNKFWIATAKGDIWKVEDRFQHWSIKEQLFQIDYQVDIGVDQYRLERGKNGRNYLSAWHDDQLTYRISIPQNPDFEDQFSRGLFLTGQGIVVVTNRDVWLYSWYGDVLKHYSNRQLTAQAFNQKLPSIISAHFSRNRLWLGTKGSGLLLVDLSNSAVIGLHSDHSQFPLVHDYWINVISSVGEEIWYGTEEGIGCITKDTAYAYNLETLRAHLDGRDKALLKEVFDLWPRSRGEWLLVSPKGILFLHHTNFKIDSLAPIWPANDWVTSFRALHAIQGNTFWVETKNQWYQWRYPQGPIHILPIPEEIARNSKWIGKPTDPKLQWGAYTLQWKEQNRINLDKVSLYLKDVRWGGGIPLRTVFYPEKEIVLDYSSNFFSFSVQFIGATPLGYTIYYRLLGWNEAWQPLHEGRASYSNLSPGTYTLEVIGRDLNGEPITDPFTQTIQVDRPFWMTWWFIGGIALFVGSIIGIIYRLRIQQVRKEERLRRSFLQQIQELEVKALRAQMNPHFMFNCLNSIRNLMLKDEQDDAVEYITMFARLLRLILQHSKQDMITLQDEFEALELYLELEKLRLDEKLTYRIEIADNVSPALQQLPPMICQPYVENAIWHGILNKQGGGTVNITASLHTDTLVIEIEDDGVGRLAAKEIEARNQAAKRKSYGMSLIKDRLSIMRDWKQIDTTVEIQDLYKSDSPAGTRVTLKLRLDDQGHLN